VRLGTVASGPKVPPAGSSVEPLPVRTAVRSAQSDQSWASRWRSGPLVEDAGVSDRQMQQCTHAGATNASVGSCWALAAGPRQAPSPGSCPPTGSSRRHDYLHCLAVVPAPPGSRHPGLCLPRRGHLLLQRLYVLCFIQLHTRGVHLAGRTVNPTGDWVAQQARNLLGSLDEEAGFRFLLRDHDSKFTRALDDRWRAVGAEERLHFATRWRRLRSGATVPSQPLTTSRRTLQSLVPAAVVLTAPGGRGNKRRMSASAGL
jgi:hypothetical protein